MHMRAQLSDLQSTTTIWLAESVCSSMNEMTPRCAILFSSYFAQAWRETGTLRAGRMTGSTVSPRDRWTASSRVPILSANTDSYCCMISSFVVYFSCALRAKTRSKLSRWMVTRFIHDISCSLRIGLWSPLTRSKSTWWCLWAAGLISGSLAVPHDVSVVPFHMCKVLGGPKCRRGVSTYLAGRRDALGQVSRRKVTGLPCTWSLAWYSLGFTEWIIPTDSLSDDSEPQTLCRLRTL